MGGRGDRPRARARGFALGHARGAAGARHRRRCSRTSRRGPSRACAAVWEHTQREGVEEPGAFPVAPELVEALVELGELDEAQRGHRSAARAGRAAGASLGARDREALRSAGAARLATPTTTTPRAALADAAADYQRLGLRFDRARSLLSLGRAQRRFKKWGAARDVAASTPWPRSTGSARPGWAERGALRARPRRRAPAARRAAS